MKTIENKETSITLNGKKIKYSDLLTSVINKPIQNGLTLQEMRRDLRLLDLFESNTETISITNDEFNYILQALEETKWFVKHKDIIEFADYLHNLR